MSPELYAAGKAHAAGELSPVLYHTNLGVRGEGRRGYLVVPSLAPKRKS